MISGRLISARSLVTSKVSKSKRNSHTSYKNRLASSFQYFFGTLSAVASLFTLSKHFELTTKAEEIDVFTSYPVYRNIGGIKLHIMFIFYLCACSRC